MSFNMNHLCADWSDKSGQTDSQIPANATILSNQGRFVVFSSGADNPVSDEDHDIFVYDQVTGATTHASVTSKG
ncbi:MAG: hypothetical protein WA919_24120 [Coleofasciculaceae cyanobacterium]